MELFLWDIVFFFYSSFTDLMEKNWWIKNTLQITDSPGLPRIYNEAREEIKRGYVGPLSLGSDLTLICEVDDGKIRIHRYHIMCNCVPLFIEIAYPISSWIIKRCRVLLRNDSHQEIPTGLGCQHNVLLKRAQNIFTLLMIINNAETENINILN